MKDNYTLHEIVLKMVGNINPNGCSSRDEEAKENLKNYCDLLNEMIINLIDISNNKISYEYSVKQIGLIADNCIKNIFEECESVITK